MHHTRNGLHRFTETHFVGQKASAAVLVYNTLYTFELIRKQRIAHAVCDTYVGMVFTWLPHGQCKKRIRHETGRDARRWHFPAQRAF